MEPITLLMTFAGVQIAATVSPGPAFLVVTRSALEGGRAAGLAAAAGCALGFLAWITATLAGLEVVLAGWTSLYELLRLAGALFLIYLAVEQWRHASEPLAPAALSGPPRATLGYFTRGILLQLANPKALAYCMSVLIVLVPPETPVSLKVAIAVLGTLIEAAWWTIIALAASRGAFRSRYDSLKGAIDRIIGIALGALGLRLLADRV